MSGTRSAILELAEEAYEAAVSPDRWPSFLERLAPLVGASSLHMVLRAPSPGDAGLVYSVGSDAGYQRAYCERYFKLDPWCQKDGDLPEGSVNTGHDFIADEELERTPFYAEWLKPQNLYYPFSAILYKPDGACVSRLQGLRSKSRGPFGSAELGPVRELVPHLKRSLSIHRDLRAAQAVRDAALQTLDLVPCGWLLLDEAGSVVARNRAADDILASGDGLELVSDSVASSNDRESEKLRELTFRVLGQTPGEGSAATMTLTRPSGREPLRVLIAPLRHGVNAADRRVAAVLFVDDLERIDHERLERLRAMYGLTPAETRVAAQLADGRRLSEIASASGISINTVRGHLKQVFSKTGTHRQAELVRLVLSGSPQLEPRPPAA